MFLNYSPCVSFSVLISLKVIVFNKFLKINRENKILDFLAHICEFHAYDVLFLYFQHLHFCRPYANYLEYAVTKVRLFWDNCFEK